MAITAVRFSYMSIEKLSILSLAILLIAFCAGIGFYLTSDLNRNAVWPPSPEERIAELEQALATQKTQSRQQRAERSATLEALRKELDRAKARVDELQSNLSRNDDRLQAMQEELQAKERAVEETRAQLAMKEERIADLHAAALKLKKAVENREEKLAAFRKQLSRAREALLEQRERLTSQQDLLEEFQGSSATAPASSPAPSAKMEAAEPGNTAGEAMPLRY